MRGGPFSICIDESTDIATKKSLCVVARTIIDSQVRDIFLCLMEVNDASAKGIYDDLKKYFENERIEYKSNLIGIGADGAAVMTGLKTSVAIFF